MKIICECGNIIPDHSDTHPSGGYLFHSEDYAFFGEGADIFLAYVAAVEHGTVATWLEEYTHRFNLPPHPTHELIYDRIAYGMDTILKTSVYECPVCFGLLILDPVARHVNYYERHHSRSSNTYPVLPRPQDRRALQDHYQHYKGSFISAQPAAYEQKAPLLPALIRQHVEVLVQEQEFHPPAWVPIPGGVTLVGASGDLDHLASTGEMPVCYVDMKPFAIARYPVTNAEYAMFVADGGYTTRTWWQVGWEIKEQFGWHGPVYWDEARFNTSTKPVVGISVYEALAYCAWLSERCGRSVTLPNDLQWETAARGRDGRIYPWGNQWFLHKANSQETGINQPLAVGALTGDCSPYGVRDMGGNVADWTLGVYDDLEYTQVVSPATLEPKTTYLSVRGGTWHWPYETMRCTSRGYSYVVDRWFHIGFRVTTEEIEGI